MSFDSVHAAQIVLKNAAFSNRLILLPIGVYAVHFLVWFIWFLYRNNQWEQDYPRADHKRKRLMRYIRRDWLLRALPFSFVIVPIYWWFVRKRREKRHRSAKLKKE